MVTRNNFLCIGLLNIGFVISTSVWAVGTTFSYQGQLQHSNSSVTSLCDFQFDLYDVPSDGTASASHSSPGVSVNDGLFTTEVDFGIDAFDGTERWLETSVECGDGITVLSPRQAILATPYAMHAGTAETAKSVDWADLSGLSCSDGQIVQWNAIAGVWQCATPQNGDITAVTAGTGLTGGGTAGELTLNADIGTAAGTVAAGDHGHTIAELPVGNDASQVAAGDHGHTIAELPVGNDASQVAAGDHVHDTTDITGKIVADAVATDNVTACDANQIGSVRFNSGQFQGCDGNAWNTFSLGGSSETVVARVYLSQGKSFVSGFNNVFDAESFDAGDNYDLINNHFVAPSSGYYQVNSCIKILWNPNVFTVLIIFVDDTAYSHVLNQIVSSQMIGATCIDDLIYLAESSTIKVSIFLGSSMYLDGPDSRGVSTFATFMKVGN